MNAPKGHCKEDRVTYSCLPRFLLSLDNRDTFEE